MITTQVHGKTYVIDGKGEFSPAEELTLEDWLHAMNAQDAAQKRHRSPETVNTHRKRIREKTDQRNGEGVLVYCFSKDYIKALMLALSIGGSGELIRSRPPKLRTGKPKVVQVMRINRQEIPGVLS